MYKSPDSFQAKPIILHDLGETIIVENRIDGGVDKRRYRPEGQWVADWAGDPPRIKPCGVNGKTEQEVIEKMTRRITFEKALARLREIKQYRITKTATTGSANDPSRIRVADQEIGK